MPAVQLGTVRILSLNVQSVQYGNCACAIMTGVPWREDATTLMWLLDVVAAAQHASVS